MSGISFRDVEVRTWPERTDVLVIDPGSVFLLAQYDLQEGDDDMKGKGPLFDPTVPYEKRSLLAIHAVEQDQEGLRRYFLLEEESVCLRRADAPRQRLEETLTEYGLSLDEVELERIDSLQRKLEEMPIGYLWWLLCDWHDVAERHYPAGTSAADPWSWLQRSRPEECRHFHLLASSMEKEATDEEAYKEFTDIVDTPLSKFSLGVFLRWIYFHRAEFPDRPIPQMSCLQELALHSSS